MPKLFVMNPNPRQLWALAFGMLMLFVVVLMAPWAEPLEGAHVVLLGAWAPIWSPPSETAVIDLLRLGVEVCLVFSVTGLCVWMMRD